MAIATELLATFVGYFLTITPPLPARETEAARTLGRLRFDDVIAGIAHRLKTDRNLIARVLDKLQQSDKPAGASEAMSAAPSGRRPGEPELHSGVTPAETKTKQSTDG